MSLFEVTALVKIKALIRAKDWTEAESILNTRIKSSETWQAFGEPGSIENDPVLEWITPVPEICSIARCVKWNEVST